MSDVPDFNFVEELNAIFKNAKAIRKDDCEDTKHEWQFRLVWREGGKWDATNPTYSHRPVMTYFHERLTETFIQRRRKRDHLDPTPCEGIEHPVWRDWEASPDPEIQAILVRKGMPFRSLEK